MRQYRTNFYFSFYAIYPTNYETFLKMLTETEPFPSRRTLAVRGPGLDSERRGGPPPGPPAGAATPDPADHRWLAAAGAGQRLPDAADRPLPGGRLHRTLDERCAGGRGGITGDRTGVAQARPYSGSR